MSNPRPSFSTTRPYVGRVYVGTGTWDGMRFKIVSANVKDDAITIRIISDSKRTEQRGEREEPRKISWLRSAVLNRLAREVGR